MVISGGDHDGGREPPPGARTEPQANQTLAKSAIEFARQAEKLSFQQPRNGQTGHVAVEAHFVTPQDPVIVTSDGNRLPAVPLIEAHRLNVLKAELEGGDPPSHPRIDDGLGVEDKLPGEGVPGQANGKPLQESGEGSLRRAMPPSHTNPLFPPLPLHGPPSLLRNVQCAAFRVSSFLLSLSFLGAIVMGSLASRASKVYRRLYMKVTCQDPDAHRPFAREESRRRKIRKVKEREWNRRQSFATQPADKEGIETDSDGYVPTEGGPDPIICDVGYYARRVGLDVEELEVQTEDGFIIDLWHVYDPREYMPLAAHERAHRGPVVFTDERRHPRPVKDGGREKKSRFPVLLMHGLLQSAGAYCVNDDNSLAFWLCKSGYDVWLGNNRCGFHPRHALLDASDPRMWCWNIRQMGVFDLPALASRVQFETGFEKISLVAHSQGTTEAFVALAKEQRPELGEKLAVFCALAPAVYAGPLIGNMYFKFLRVISPAMFRVMFGIASFIPVMMFAHAHVPSRIYGWLGYGVFNFLFNWTDTRWDRGLRDRMFQFAPVYVSAESMRWWLGRECFAKHKCILATKEESRAEEREDSELEQSQEQGGHAGGTAQTLRIHARGTGMLVAADRDMEGPDDQQQQQQQHHRHHRKPRGSKAWYNEQAPPFALFVCGRDELVDGEKLLRRFERGREPHVRVVHRSILDDYEHLDVIWAMDAPERVFKDVREVLWKTCGEEARRVCRVPVGCENVKAWSPEEEDEERRREEPGLRVSGEDNGLQSGSSSEDQ